MRGRFGLIVVALAAMAWLACENESFAGRRHRGCSSCGSCGTAACANGACEAPAAPATPPAAAPSAATPDAEASQEVAKAAQSEPPAPVVVEQPRSRGTYYVSRRAMRRARR